MTYKETIDLGIRILELAGIEEAENDAWLLLSKECKMDRTAYYMHMKDEILPEQLNEYKGLIKKRAERVPLQYITGEQEFMGLTFHVNSNVLIPRQDTEALVEEAIKLVELGMSILDMCTGSGCIIISILKKCSGIQGTGSDISKQALNVAKENAKLNNVAVDFERSDMFENLSDKYDMIVSNPPYIRSDVVPTLMPEVCEFEPLDALDGHEDGLYFYRKIIKECKSFLKEDGKILFEIGNDQGQAVSDMLTYAGFRNVRVIKDLAHNDRVVVGML